MKSKKTIINFVFQSHSKTLSKVNSFLIIKHIEIIPRKEFFSKYIFKIFIYETEEKSEKF